MERPPSYQNFGFALGFGLDLGFGLEFVKLRKNVNFKIYTLTLDNIIFHTFYHKNCYF